MDTRDATNDAAVNPGERLKAARERAGWSIEQVALKLRLSVAQVAALEKGEREGLPPAAYVRGYLRSYAQLLGLDPQEFAKARASVGSPAETQRPTVGPRTKLPWETLAYALFVVGLAAVVVWWRMDNRGAPTRPAQDTVSSVEAIGALPPRLRSLAIPGASDGQLSEFPLRRGPLMARSSAAHAPGRPIRHVPVSGAPASQPPATRQVAPSRKAFARRVVPPSKMPAKGVLTPGVKIATGVARLPASAPSAVPNPGGLISLPQGRHYTTLHIRATSGAVRISVRDAKGTRLLAARIAAGHGVRVVGLPPFSVALSRSRGVFMTVGGRAVAIPSVRNGRRLRVTVDQ